MRHTPPRGRFPRMRGGRFIGVPRRGRPANATRGVAGPRRGHPSRAALGGRIAAVVLMVLGLLGLGSSAWAYWTSSGVGTGAATTATLNAPGTPVITHTSGTQSVGVSWAAPSGGVLPEGYYVTRVSQPGGVQVHVCGSPTVLVVPTSCVDNPVPAGSFHYLVTAVYRSWTSTSGPSPSVVIVTDVTAPVVTVTHVNGAARTFPFTVQRHGGHDRW